MIMGDCRGVFLFPVRKLRCLSFRVLNPTLQVSEGDSMVMLAIPLEKKERLRN